MQKSIWIFGILAGLLCALLEFLFFSSVNSNAVAMYVSKIAVLVICLGAGLILTKKLLGGQISIARTLLSGILISMVRAAIMIIAFLALYAPDGAFYQVKVNESFEQAALKVQQDDNVKPADKPMELKTVKQQISAQYKPMGYIMICLGSSLVSGLIISILMAAFIGTNMMYKQ
jgi:hypothetical protein|tara:strand:- start:1365 stop:1886 length:522 start_codon:yes stop_codon:yes gene_type:complete